MASSLCSCSLSFSWHPFVTLCADFSATMQLQLVSGKQPNSPQDCASHQPSTSAVQKQRRHLP